MSDKKSKDNVPKHFKPRNLGAAGFPVFEFRGEGFDHVNEYMRFTTQWKSYVVTAFNKQLECIINDGWPRLLI